MTATTRTLGLLTTRRIARDAACLVGVLWLVSWFVLRFALPWQADVLAFWSVDPARPWHIPIGEPGSFNYPPPAALAFLALHAVPWPLFATSWFVMNVGLAFVFLRRIPWLALVLALPLVAELWVGQIQLLLAAAIVVGFRWPAAWALVLLTKPTAGVGVLWFAVRREWTGFLIALATTAALAVFSAAVAPSWWADWAAHLTGRDVWTIWLRVGAGALIVAWGARTNRRWTVPVASMVALPVLWVSSFAMLAGAAYLWAEDRRP